MEDKVMLLILYASQTGNAMDAAERLGREAERRGCPVAVLSTDQFDAVSRKSANLSFFRQLRTRDESMFVFSVTKHHANVIML